MATNEKGEQAKGTTPNEGKSGYRVVEHKAYSYANGAGTTVNVPAHQEWIRIVETVRPAKKAATKTAKKSGKPKKVVAKAKPKLTPQQQNEARNEAAKQKLAEKEFAEAAAKVAVVAQAIV